MQQFVVPQFIDVEDKIFGPITIRQFLILVVTGGVLFVAYRLADLALFALIVALVGGFSLVLAFARINGQAFHYFLLNIGQYARAPHLRVWNKLYTNAELDFFRKQVVEEFEAAPTRKKEKRERIRDLSLLVNTGGYYRPEDDVIGTIQPSAAAQSQKK
jgi:hypothetical protein